MTQRKVVCCCHPEVNKSISYHVKKDEDDGKKVRESQAEVI